MASVSSPVIRRYVSALLAAAGDEPAARTILEVSGNPKTKTPYRITGQRWLEESDLILADIASPELQKKGTTEDNDE